MSACLVSHYEWWHDRPRSQPWVPLMSAYRYIEENGSAAMMATKRSVGVTPEINLRECVTSMPIPSANKAAHSGYETQRRHHQKSKTGVSVAPSKWLTGVLQTIFKKRLWGIQFFTSVNSTSVIQMTEPYFKFLSCKLFANQNHSQAQFLNNTQLVILNAKFGSLISD